MPLGAPERPTAPVSSGLDHLAPLRETVGFRGVLCHPYSPQGQAAAHTSRPWLHTAVVRHPNGGYSSPRREAQDGTGEGPPHPLALSVLGPLLRRLGPTHAPRNAGNRAAGRTTQA